MDTQTALLIAVMTVTLRHVLEEGLSTSQVARALGDVRVDVRPPTQVDAADARSRLNLFLYRVAPFVQSSLAQNRAHFGVDLHYLLCVTGEQDYHTEALLGCAIEAMRQHTKLSAKKITDALKAAALSGGDGALWQPATAHTNWVDADAKLSVTPVFLSLDELARLWSALHLPMRPAIAYQVSAGALRAPE